MNKHRVYKYIYTFQLVQTTNHPLIFLFFQEEPRQFLLDSLFLISTLLKMLYFHCKTSDIDFSGISKPRGSALSHKQEAVTMSITGPIYINKHNPL